MDKNKITTYCYMPGTMINSYCLLIFLVFSMISCNKDEKFDKERWLINNDLEFNRNPRAYMTEDLLKNYLKVGLTRDSILSLLGKPYKEGVEQRLPKGMEMPESLSFSNQKNLKSENNDKATDRINEFMRLNSQPDTLMLYPVGWSTTDPNFLVIKFDNKGISYDFWIEQH